jgi:hypothetical protein
VQQSKAFWISAMFFRFCSAIVLAMAVSLGGTALEKRKLELKRAVSRQHYRLDVLLEQHAARRVLAQQLAAPSRMVEATGSAAASGSARRAPPREVLPERGGEVSRIRPRNSAPYVAR